jgi:general secretion pathway protein G
MVSLMHRKRAARGFTLMELVVVMTVIGLLLTLALPRYLDAVDRGKEKVLERNLALMREAIDRYYGDQGRYPDRLEDLVTKRYLRAIPPDPFTERATWVVIAPTDVNLGGVIDVDTTGTDLQGRARGTRMSAPEGGDDENGAAPERQASPRNPTQGGTRQTVTVDPAGDGYR